METDRSEHPTSREGVRAARDLTVEDPRAFGLELEGYAHLPRMLDKARATLAGTAGSYQFGCPVDHTCMARLGVTPEIVLDLAALHADDRCVLRALRDHGIPSADEAWFDEDVPFAVELRDGDPVSELSQVWVAATSGAAVATVV